VTKWVVVGQRYLAGAPVGSIREDCGGQPDWIAKHVPFEYVHTIVRDHNAMPKMKNLEAVMKQLVAYFEVNERIRKQLPDVLWGRIQAALELDDDPPQAD